MDGEMGRTRHAEDLDSMFQWRSSTYGKSKESKWCRDLSNRDEGVEWTNVTEATGRMFFSAVHTDWIDGTMDDSRFAFINQSLSNSYSDRASGFSA